MSDINKTKWDFKPDLNDLVDGCIGVKKATARKKATKFLNQYFPLLQNHKNELSQLQDEIRTLKNKCIVLKTGVINFNVGCSEHTSEQNAYEVSGSILLSEIMQVEIGKEFYKGEYTLLITKSGREIQLPGRYKFIKDLL